MGVMLPEICYSVLFQLGHDGSSGDSLILTEVDRD
jgi:hypothetical protein